MCRDVHEAPATYSIFCSYLQQRWITIFLSFLASFNVYAMRTCLAVTITEMVVPLNITDNVIDDSCPDNEDTSLYKNETITAGEKYEWNEHTQGLILSSYYWGYFITNIVGGMIADKFGGRYTLCFGILSVSILTILTPISVQWGGATALIAIRILMGICEGPVFPALSTLVAKWIPEFERSWAVSCAFSGMDAGTIFGMGITGAIIRYSGSWSTVYYFFGSCGIFCFLLICAFCYSQPGDSPFISRAEREYLKKNLKHTSEDAPATPWRHIIRSKPVWALLILTLGQTYGFLAMISDLPKYMSSILKFPVDTNGYISAVGPMCSFLSSNISCWFADKIIARKLLSTVVVRKISGIFATVGPGIFLVLTSYAGCNTTLAVVFYAIGWVFSGFYNCSITSNSLDLAPNFAGTLLGFIFGMSNLSGFLSPYIVGLLIPNQTIAEWRLVFWIVLLVFSLSSLVFLIFGSADVQKWNEPDLSNEVELMNENDQKEKTEIL